MISVKASTIKFKPEDFMAPQDIPKTTDPFVVSQSAVTGATNSNFYASLPSRQSFVKLLQDPKQQQNPVYIRNSVGGLR